MSLLETYSSRLFMNELINACFETNTEYIIAPYQATPQIVYLFKHGLVNAICGSSMCLLQTNDHSLDQVIIDFDLENGLFSFITKSDLESLSPQHKKLDNLIDLFLVFGALYGITVIENTSNSLFA